jgi:release factor glutamine methyltransferase
LNPILSVRECWLTTQQQLVEHLSLDLHEAKLEAQLLLQTVLNVDRAWLIAHESDALQADTHVQYQALVSRRLNGEPIAYILGYREFYGLSFKVSPATLIPRPDTETLVETALSKLPQQERVAVLDLGTGSGAIALAIAKHRPLCSVLALDASEAALAVAKNNADRLSIVNANFLQSDWFSELGLQRFELIVSNPPYIEEHDAHLSQGDLRFEPVSALASGKDGLNDIRRIISDCLVYLKPQGWLMLEHGYNQAHAVSALMAEHGLVSVETIQDLSGNDRVTIGRNPLIVSTHWD